MDLSSPNAAAPVHELGAEHAAGRLAFVDAARVAMIVLVLGMHAAVTYSPFGNWYLREHPPLGTAQTLFFLTFQAFLQGFFMALLFFIAGCFTPGAYDRKDFRRFAAGRLYRLGLPTLLFALLIGPLTEYYVAGSWRTRASFPEAYQRYIISGGVFSGSGPLWFCVALLIFSLAYALLRLALPMSRPQRVPTPAGVALTAATIALTTFLVKTQVRSGTTVLNMQLADFPSYIIMFTAGVMAGRNEWLQRVPARFAGRSSRPARVNPARVNPAALRGAEARVGACSHAGMASIGRGGECRRATTSLRR